MIVVTGATGHLGRLVVAGLLEALPAEAVVVAARTPDKAADLAARGAQVRHADYDEPDTLPAALAGADKLLLISGDAVGRRVAQHKAVVDAAVSAGVGLVVYTSVLRASTTHLAVAPEHKATEETILASGLPYVFLRNGWYSENYTQTARDAAESGVIIGSSGDGRVASATRADYAAAAVAVLTTDGHENTAYELAGDTGWTKAQLAAEVARISGRDVVYRNVTKDEHRAALVEAGLPEPLAAFYASVDGDIERGALDDTSGRLRALIGRPTTTLADFLRTTLRT